MYNVCLSCYAGVGPGVRAGPGAAVRRVLSAVAAAGLPENVLQSAISERYFHCFFYQIFIMSQVCMCQFS